MTNGTLYLFIDESGNFDFSLSGTKFYTITTLITNSPWEKAEQIIKLRHQILARELFPDLSFDYLDHCLSKSFHASEDKQVVRDAFFDEIVNMKSIYAHSIIVRKNKTNPSLRQSDKFYPKILGYLLDYVFKSYEYSNVCIVLDGTPINKKRGDFIGAIKSEIKNKNPKTDYFIYFPQSQSNVFLQVTDYINWAIYRKWEYNDFRSYDLIKRFLRTPELDIFIHGDEIYY